MKVICLFLMIFVSLGHARDTKNLYFPKENREACVGPSVEWIEKGPICEAFCDHQPNIFSGGAHQHKQCQTSMYDAVHHVLNNAEDPSETFHQGAIDMDKIAVNVTKMMRTWGTSRLYVNEPESYEGCYCKDGFARYGDECVPLKDCPATPFTETPAGRSGSCNDPNEEFHSVSEHCEVYCEIQPLRFGRGRGSINSCGKTGDYVRSFIPRVGDYRNVFDTPKLIEKYAENITESMREDNNETFSDGCYCNKGYARYGYRCIKLEHCPTRKCVAGEFFKTDGPVCEPTCQNIQYHHKLSFNGEHKTISGCFCQGGMVRDDRGKCIEPQECWNYNQQPPVKEEPKQEYHYHYVDTIDEAIKDAQRINAETNGAVNPVIQTPVATEFGSSVVNLRLGSGSKDPVGDEEKPIYNRKVLTEPSNTPVVDGFKAELVVPIVPIVPVPSKAPIVPVPTAVAVDSVIPTVKVETPASAQEKVVEVGEMKIPVVAIYDQI